MTEETTHILTNKPVPDDITKRLDELAFNQRLLFFIVGDLSKDSMYSQSVLAVTDKGLYCFDRTYDEGYKFASHESIEDIKIKRLYGNAIMVISAQS